MGVQIYTIKQYIESQDSLDAKISAIQKLIDSMLLNSIDAVDNSGTASYSLDDGQMKVTTNYRSVVEITNGVHSLEKILHMYVNRRNGRTVVLRGRLNY